MIKNIVFDMGNVILSYNPQYIIEHFTDDKKLQLTLIEGIFNTPEWLALDSGEICFTDACLHMKERLDSSLAPLVDKVMNEWYYHMPQFEGMVPLIQDLKTRGYKIYLLSNTSKSFYQYYESVKAFALFDGLYVSADHQMLKPDPNIFKHFCKTFNLQPEECFFIDDNLENITSAKSIGMSGVCFNGNQDSPTIIENEIRQLL